jgi:hypothetical protein
VIASDWLRAAWHAYNVGLDALLIQVALFWPVLVCGYLAWALGYTLWTLGRGHRG